MRITCSVCGEFLELNRIYLKVYCRSCENQYKREYRKTYVLPKPEEKKNKCRSLAYSGLKSGKLIPQPCEKCGETKVEMHHEDYDKPLEVIWLCRICHMDLHNERKLEGVSKELESQAINV